MTTVVEKIFIAVDLQSILIVDRTVQKLRAQCCIRAQKEVRKRLYGKVGQYITATLYKDNGKLVCDLAKTYNEFRDGLRQTSQHRGVLKIYRDKYPSA